jgi:hypothetical protein
VIIIALLDAETVLMERHFAIRWNGTFYELPAGKIEPARIRSRRPSESSRRSADTRRARGNA